MSFPGEPVDEVQRVTSAGGVEVDLRQLRLAEELSAKMLMVTDNALVGPLADAAPADALAELVRGQRQGPRRTLVSERALERDGFPGHELVMRSEDLGSDKVEITWRVFIARGRLYQLMATASDEASRARVARFLESFRFTALPAGGPAAGAGGRDAWAAHAAAEGDFEAAWPTAPTRKAEARESAWGRRGVVAYEAVGAFPPALYTVVVVPLAPDERGRPLSELLGAWEALTLRGGGGGPLTLEERGAVPLAGRTARALRVSARHGEGSVTARYLGLVYDDRFYELGFLPLDERAGAVEAARFFGGFSVRAGAAP